MTHPLRLLTLGVTVALAGCGGGSSSGTSGTTTLAGTAATGAAFEGASITVLDRNGTQVGASTSVGSDGRFSIALSAGAQAPFILTATRTNAAGASESLVSVVPSVSANSASTPVNLSPITTLIASRLSASGNPATLASEVAAGTATISTSTVNAKVTEIQTILSPLLNAVGVAGVDPLTGNFSTDGTGYDRLLDSLKVTITPASSISANVEVGIKQSQADGADPVAISFTNGASQTPAASIEALPASNTYTLVESGTSAKITAFLTQLNNCLALPPSTRVPSGTSAADIAAPACRQAFFGDDPTGYKHNGKQVGATGAFSGLFNSGVQNTVFSQGSYEFTNSGDESIVVSYRSRTAAGAETFDTLVLKGDTDGKLKLRGNQYDYGGSVTAYHQIRRFPSLNQSASDYYSTGYNISIPKAGLDHVEVTTPRGGTLVLKPQTGSDNLQLLKGWTGSGANPVGGTLTGTSFVRIRSEYADSGNTADPAASSEGDRLFFVGTPYANADIAKLKAQGVWTFKYYLAGAPTTAAATQYYKTRARSLTIPELRTQTWAALTDAQRNSLSAAALPAGAGGAGRIPVTDGRANLALAYTVPAGALPPTNLQLWGRYTTDAWVSFSTFSDNNKVASTARAGTIACANASGGDAHCADGGFANPTRIDGIHLWAADTGGREFANFYAFYPL